MQHILCHLSTYGDRDFLEVVWNSPQLNHMPNHCEYMYVHANDHMSPPVTSQDIGGQWSVRKEGGDASKCLACGVYVSHTYPHLCAWALSAGVVMVNINFRYVYAHSKN